MSYLVASIEHHARVLANTVKRALAEKCSGLSDYEASDYLAEEPWADALADIEAEEEVAEPCEHLACHMNPVTRVVACNHCHAIVEQGVAEPRAVATEQKRYSIAEIFRLWDQHVCRCGHIRRDHERPYTGACPAFVEPKTPAASAGRGESSSPGVSAGPTPTAPSGERLNDALNRPWGIADLSDDWLLKGAFPGGIVDQWGVVIGRFDDPITAAAVVVAVNGAYDPSPTSPPASQPRVCDEGSPADSDIPPSPAGERPDWPTWAVPAICDVLADHQFVDIMTEDDADWKRYGCYHAGEDRTHQWLVDEHDWRDHVAPLIAEHLDTAMKSQFTGCPTGDTGDPRDCTCNKT